MDFQQSGNCVSYSVPLMVLVEQEGSLDSSQHPKISWSQLADRGFDMAWYCQGLSTSSWRLRGLNNDETWRIKSPADLQPHDNLRPPNIFILSIFDSIRLKNMDKNPSLACGCSSLILQCIVIQIRLIHKSKGCRTKPLFGKQNSLLDCNTERLVINSCCQKCLTFYHPYRLQAISITMIPEELKNYSKKAWHGQLQNY